MIKGCMKWGGGDERVHEVGGGVSDVRVCVCGGEWRPDYMAGCVEVGRD